MRPRANVGAALVDLLGGAQEGRCAVGAELAGGGGEGADVLGEAATAVPDAGPHAAAADARVDAEDVHDLGDVAAGGLAHVGDGVDVRDLEAEEGVGRALGEFRGLRVGDEQGGSGVQDGGVDGSDCLLALGGGETGDEAIRTQGVLDGVSLAQELRVPYDVDAFAGGGQALGELGDLAGRADGDRAFPDDGARPVEVGSELADGAEDLPGVVGPAVRADGGADPDEVQLGEVGGLPDAGGEPQAPARGVLGK